MTAFPLHHALGRHRQIRANWKTLIKNFEKETGNRVTILKGSNDAQEVLADHISRLEKEDADIDVYVVDTVWAPQLAHHFLDVGGPAAAVTGICADARSHGGWHRAEAAMTDLLRAAGNRHSAW